MTAAEAGRRGDETPRRGRRGRDRRAVQRSAARTPPDQALSTSSWTERPDHLATGVADEVSVDLGWGRLLFGQTFATHDALLEALREEEPGRRDICLYVREPQVFVSRAPHELFLDPSHTYRLWLHGRRSAEVPDALLIRGLDGERDAEEAARITAAAGMVPSPPELALANQRRGTVRYLVAEDTGSGEVVGVVTGVDHVRAFDDEEGGTSLWALAVAADAVPGTGAALVEALADRFAARGRSYLDLSVLHDNDGAIALYEKLGFERVPVFCVKRKNEINEPLYTGADDRLDGLNPYARLVADEALRRGVGVTVLDAPSGLLELAHAGRSVLTRESLSELTPGVAVAMCDDKRVTRRVLADAGLPVPEGREVTDDEGDLAFLDRVGRVVVKPARGEQGAGITLHVTTATQLRDAVALARRSCAEVLLEQQVTGDDLRIVVIDGVVVAAAVRQPPEVVGTGVDTVAELIERLSRRRAALTDGEATVPFDDVTRSVVAAAGRSLDAVLPAGERLRVRDTANLHTGGTLHDVTARLAPRLVEVAEQAAARLRIPVVGLDLIVDDPTDPTEVAVIEANERPGLANHEPHPTAAAFLDLLFPTTARPPHRAEPVTVTPEESDRAG